jgi:hypothetical protein
MQICTVYVGADAQQYHSLLQTSNRKDVTCHCSTGNGDPFRQLLEPFKFHTIAVQNYVSFLNQYGKS